MSEKAAIAFPDESLGAGGQILLTQDIYILGGVFDANGGVRSFFKKNEYLRIVEAGWTPTTFTVTLQQTETNREAAE